jgi:hypothetical protein
MAIPTNSSWSLYKNEQGVVGRPLNYESTQKEMEICLSENKRCPQKEIGYRIVLNDAPALKMFVAQQPISGLHRLVLRFLATYN